ncbi:probable G-protein coupled receptor No18 [Saccostrea cucullata]|uniref:probable G-protein coupled receptor No18 n=1 Tax=Saccostrea cuccullata TaxID=36930 RepID=UPI002ED2F558
MNSTDCHTEQIDCSADEGLPGCPLKTSDLIVIGMLAVFSVIGIIGNGIVIFVYTKKKDKLTSSVFILGLAVYDFLTCSIIIPYTACMIYLRFMILYDALCKIYMFLLTFSVPLSAFLMVAIAVDRYLCICHPFLHLLNKTRARAVIGLLTVFACVLGILSCISYSVYMYADSSPGEFSNCTDATHSKDGIIHQTISTPYQQEEYTGQCNYPGTIVGMAYLITWQKIYSSFYLISLIIVLLLYTMIYYSVTRRRSNRRKQKAMNNISLKASLKEPPKQNTSSPTSSFTVLSANDNNENAKEQKILQVEIGDNGVSSRPVENADETSPLQQQQAHKNHHHHHIKDHDTIANIKTALMLFIVAVVFIIAFFPAWLMALGAVNHNNIVFYMYFAYNVTNPIIYAFMNPTFRSDVKKICH